MAKRFHSEHLEEFQAPKKKLESAGDLLIKKYLQKQQNIKINLQQQLAHPKIFEKPKELIPLSSEYQGVCSAESLQNWDDELKKLEELKTIGLTNEEISLYKDYKSKGVDYLYKNHKNHNRPLLFEKISKIESIIRDFENSKQSSLTESEDKINVNIINPQLMIKPNSVETQLLKFTLTNKEKNVSMLEHPMNEITDLEKTFNDSVDVNTNSVNINKIRRKARKLGNKLVPVDNVSKPIPIKSSSKWDLKTRIEENVPTKSLKKYTCSSQNFYTIQDGEIVKINSDSVKDKTIQIEQDKLTLEDILKIPKFKNFSKGDVNKVLYIKNLPNKIEETDLRNIFFKFNQNNELIFKIMSGKMKGQAFVHFTDSNQASQALEDLNGLILNGKPMIIAFGRKKSDINL